MINSKTTLNKLNYGSVGSFRFDSSKLYSKRGKNKKKEKNEPSLEEISSLHRINDHSLPGVIKIYSDFILNKSTDKEELLKTLPILMKSLKELIELLESNFESTTFPKKKEILKQFYDFSKIKILLENSSEIKELLENSSETKELLEDFSKIKILLENSSEIKELSEDFSKIYVKGFGKKSSKKKPKKNFLGGVQQDINKINIDIEESIKEKTNTSEQFVQEDINNINIEDNIKESIKEEINSSEQTVQEEINNINIEDNIEESIKEETNNREQFVQEEINNINEDSDNKKLFTKGKTENNSNFESSSLQEEVANDANDIKNILNDLNREKIEVEKLIKSFVKDSNLVEKVFNTKVEKFNIINKEPLEIEDLLNSETINNEEEQENKSIFKILAKKLESLKNKIIPPNQTLDTKFLDELFTPESEKIKEKAFTSSDLNPTFKRLAEQPIEKVRPSESYIQNIVELAYFHSQRDFLKKYYIENEQFTEEDFIKYKPLIEDFDEFQRYKRQRAALNPVKIFKPRKKDLKLLSKALLRKEKELLISFESENEKNEKETKKYQSNNFIFIKLLFNLFNFFTLDFFKSFTLKKEPRFNKNFIAKKVKKKSTFQKFEELNKNISLKGDKQNLYPDLFNEFLNENSNRSSLEKYGNNLTQLAILGLLDPCFGREKELSSLLEILARRQKNNPVLIGEPGVGKTAIVELLASRLVSGEVPFILLGRDLISLDLTRMVGGARYRGDFEERIQGIIDEVKNTPNIIVFIDELHLICKAGGSSEGAMDAGNILKPVLSRSGFQCIGATTLKEYQEIEKDGALSRRFQPIIVEEPSIEETVEIMYGLRPTIEMYHNIEILPGAFKAAAELSSRYIPDRFLPDKALDLIDRAAARQVIRMTSQEYNSIVTALINSVLRNIGKLKNEAFRRGDIATEFIFQEVENAYRNLLLVWTEEFRMIPLEKTEIKDEFTKERVSNSPVGASMFNLIQKVILGRMDELLFSSNSIYTKISPSKTITQIENVSKNKNLVIYNDIFEELKEFEQHNINLYRSSLFLFYEWLRLSNFENKNSVNLEIIENYNFDNVTYDELVINYESIDGLDYLNNLQQIYLEDDLRLFSSSDDFLNYDQNFERKKLDQLIELTELESTQIKIFETFLTELKPIIKSGIVESFVLSSDFSINQKDIQRIYALLGYYSTTEGDTFLQTFNEPELMKEARLKNNMQQLKNRIGREEIQLLVADLTGIPSDTLTKEDHIRLQNLEEELHKRVIGQEEAINAVARAIRRSRVGLRNLERPIASFLFCGPTGVGKTEVTKALSACLFGSEKEMIRLDMSEYRDKFNLSRLIGSPPGYVGYEDGGELTDAVRRKPYSVVLFDELEKASKEILTILLQILEDGRLTDSKKRVVSFKNTVVILTSNAAAAEIKEFLNVNKKYQIKKDVEEKEKEAQKIEEEKKKEEENLAFEHPYVGVVKFFKAPVQESHLTDIHNKLRNEYKKSFFKKESFELYNEALKENSENELNEKDKTLIKEKEKIVEEKIPASEQKLLKELQEKVFKTLGDAFLPEFINRIDEVIIFKPLRPNEIRKICDIMIESIITRCLEKGYTLKVDDPVRNKLASEGYSADFGARPLRRLITRRIEDLLVEDILANPDVPKNTVFRIVLDENDEISCIRRIELEQIN